MPDKKKKKKGVSEYYNFPCPKCGEKKTKSYVYGILDNLKSISPKEKLGGASIKSNSPKWYCEKCKHKWGKI